MPTSTLILPTVNRHNTAPGYAMDTVYTEDKTRIPFKPRTRKHIKHAANRRTRRTVNRVLATAGAEAL